MTQDAPLDQNADWRCAKCDCRTFARMDTRLPDTSFGPGDFVRCVSCKDESFFPDALSRRVPASGGELTRYAMETLTGGTIPLPVVRDYGEWVKFSDLAASPRIAAPEGWRTVPVEPTPEMLSAGLKKNSANPHPWLPAVYRAMLAAAPSISEGKAEPGEAAVIERCRQVILSHIAGMSGLDGLLHMIADEIQALSTPEPSHE